MSKLLKLIGLLRELLFGDYKTVSFWSAVFGIIIVVFGLNFDAETQAEVSGVIAAVAGAIVTVIHFVQLYLQSKKE